MTSNTATLADAYAAAKAELEAVEARVKALRNEIMATGLEAIEGQHAIVTVGLSERGSLDQKLAKTFLTAEQLAACTKTTLIETLRVKVKMPVAA